MAHIQPEGWRDMSVTGAAQREIETLTLLAQALPDEYTIFHGVHWTQLDNIGHTFSVYGEIDFIVLSPQGRLLLIEQKSGFLLRSVSALRQRFGNEGDKLSIDYLLYCPDYQVKKIEAAGLAADRIVDARQRDRLASIIQTILPAAAAPTAQRERVLRFLNNVLQLVPDPFQAARTGHSRQRQNPARAGRIFCRTGRRTTPALCIV